MTPEVADALRTQQQRFKEKFGPGPGDPVFFDPDADTPQEMDAEKLDNVLIEAMVKADMDPSYIYAFKKTGLLVTRTTGTSYLPRTKRNGRRP